MSSITRPGADEHAPYYSRYISRVADGDVLDLLERQGREAAALLRALPEERGVFRYAPDKWSVKEVVGHVADSERIFAYRALRIGRADRTPMPGFEQDDYVRAAGFDARPLRELTDELAAVRGATIALFRGLEGEALARRGTANGQEVTPRALLYIIVGHERHHLDILRERYLVDGGPPRDAAGTGAGRERGGRDG